MSFYESFEFFKILSKKNSNFKSKCIKNALSII